jgi:hypothetical protein
MLVIGFLIPVLILVSLGTGIAAFLARSTAGATVCEVISRISTVTARNYVCESGDPGRHAESGKPVELAAVGMSAV